MPQIADPTLVGQTADAIQNKALMAYYNAKLQGDSDTLAFQKAQEAVKFYMSLSDTFGFAPGGNPYTFGPGGATPPPPGTPTLNQGTLVGSTGYVPGYTGSYASQTMGNLAQMATTAQGAAGQTGWYYAPQQSEYTPGSWVRLDPSTYDTSRYGDVQISYVLPSGQMQRMSTTQARAMGWDGDLSKMYTAPAQHIMELEQAPPSNAPQQTLQGLKTYADVNTARMNQALGESTATGYYTAPQQSLPPGTNLSGGRFEDLPAETQHAYYVSNGGDWQAAQQKWVADSNAAINQAYTNAGGQPGGPNAPGAPGQRQMTTAYQEQLYTQWLRAAEEARQQWTAQQTASNNYLTLLSNLRGPADWAKYQQVLGATPQGTRDLVAAAAGQYIPGGGATTGQQPQGANLNTLYNQATGANTGSQQELQQMQGTLVAPNQMAPQTWNALTPSQRDMLLGVWESQGYAKDDAKALFEQALPKYASQAYGGGSYRLQ